jgi:hypothetical protein
MTLPDPRPCYAVYHANNPLAMLFPEAEREALDDPSRFTRVAEVNAPLEQLFEVTNHRDATAWTDRQQVIWHLDTPLRSTSVGDVFLSCQTGQAWLVMPVGLRLF